MCNRTLAQKRFLKLNDQVSLRTFWPRAIMSADARETTRNGPPGCRFVALVVSAFVLLSACGHGWVEQSIVAESLAGRDVDPTQAQTYAYDCEAEYSFTVQIQDAHARLFLPDANVTLEYVVSASGAKYVGAGVIFWSKGQDWAFLETRTRQYKTCRSNPWKAVWQDARLRGVDIRALGQEPGWYLEIDEGGQMRFVGDYGERRVVMPAPVPEIDTRHARTIYRAKGSAHTMTVVLHDKICHDAMSGKRFEMTVWVNVDGQDYWGCGRALH